MEKKWYWVIFVILLIIAIFTRIYKLDTLLEGLHVDEVGMGYDAFCIAGYGVDRYLNPFPVYMINYGGRPKCTLYLPCSYHGKNPRSNSDCD